MLFAWKLLCFLGRNGTVSQDVEESGMGRRRRRRLRQLLRLREGNAPRLSLLLPAVVRPDPSYPALPHLASAGLRRRRTGLAISAGRFRPASAFALVADSAPARGRVDARHRPSGVAAGVHPLPGCHHVGRAAHLAEGGKVQQRRR